jgi:hypothetical protein
MKTMKKTMILTAVLFVSTFFMSCSSDDDTPQDTIIGKWQLEQRFTDNVEETLSEDCDKKSTLEFKTDNTFIDIESFVEQNEPCSSSTDPGTWEYNGDSALKVSYDGDTNIYSGTYSFVNGELNLILGDDIDDIETTKTVWKRIN